MLTTRLLGLDEYAVAADFLDRYWAKGHVYVRERRLFDWTFARPGFSGPGTYSFAVAEEGGEVCGVLGGIPFLFNRLGVGMRGFWLANWLVRPEYRRGTAGLDLLSHFYRPGELVTISFGINATVARLYGVMRWCVMEDAPRYFAVLDGAEGEMGRLLRLANAAWDGGRCDEVARSLVRPMAGGSLRAASMGVPDWAQWDASSWKALAPQMIGAARDGAYLRWRYAEHPSLEYRFISIAEGERMGLMVWRLETIRRRSEGGLEDVGGIGRVVEFLPVSEENARGLVGQLMGSLREAGAFGADCYLYHGPLGAWLERCGFCRLDGHPDGRGIPSRFQPLDGSGGRIMSAVWCGEGPGPAYPYDAACAWYWTKSDSDQDRPN